MRKVMVAIVVSVTVVALSQDRGPGIVLRPSGPAPHWDKGGVEGRTYRNATGAETALLQPLLQLADSRKDMIHEIGRFYAHLLDRHTAITVDELGKLAQDKQRLICQLAGEDEYSLDQPKLERVTQRLHGIGNQTANQCLQVAETAANDVPWRQQQK